MEQYKNPIIKRIANKYIPLIVFIVISLITISINRINFNLSIKAESKNSTINNLLQEQYYKELSLNLPSVTNAQNLEVIFANPNDNKKYPITIIIDNKKFEKAKSPFKLPDLEIGTHTITFKYTNKDGIPRTLTTLLTIVPKAPVLNQKNKTLFFRPEPISITGKALAFSKIMVIINSTDVQYIPVNSNGDWEFTIKSPRIGVYNILFYTYKNGIISKNYAKIRVKYDIQQTNTNTTTNIKKNKIKNIITTIRNLSSNKEYLYIGSGIFGIIFLVFIFLRIRKILRNKWEQKEIIELINKQKPKKDIVKIIKNVEQDQNINKKSPTKQPKSSKVNSKVKTSKKKHIKHITKTPLKNNKKIKNQTTKKVEVKKKVLSKEEFLSMFKKAKNKS